MFANYYRVGLFFPLLCFVFKKKYCRHLISILFYLKFVLWFEVYISRSDIQMWFPPHKIYS